MPFLNIFNIPDCNSSLTGITRAGGECLAIRAEYQRSGDGEHKLPETAFQITCLMRSHVQYADKILARARKILHSPSKFMSVRTKRDVFYKRVEEHVPGVETLG